MKGLNVVKLNENFFSDLKNAYLGESLVILTEAFWCDLKALNVNSDVSHLPMESNILEKLGGFFDHWAKNTVAFLIAIENIHELDMRYVDESEICTLKQLDDFLPRCNEKIAASLKNKIEKLNNDSPLFCPISLYQGIDGGRMEVSHTRTLCWLIDPGERESHGFSSNVMIKAFLEHAAPEFAGRITQVISVRTELVALGCAKRGSRHKKKKKYGRLDIIINCKLKSNDIETKGVVLVEAKVDAKEGENQLESYEQWLTEYCEENQITEGDRLMVFLSRHKETTTNKKKWAHLSYLNLFESFSKVLANNTEKHGYHFLRYYLAGIMMDILEWPLPISVKTETEPFAWQLAVLLDDIKT